MLIQKSINKKYILLIAGLLFLTSGIGIYTIVKPKPPLEEKFVTEEKVIRNLESPFNELTKTPKIFNAPNSYEIPSKKHTYQTFNNCGPATLSMYLSYYGISTDQETLGNQMRPYQHPKGDNDDKTIFPVEFTEWAGIYGEDIGLKVMYLPNGSLKLLKLFVSNDIPVVVKTRLNLKEDIGHFILVRGYNIDKEYVLVDDSYYGPNKKVSFYNFLSLWQSFNYSYIIAYANSQTDTVETMLGKEMDPLVAWQNAVERAHKENELTPDSIYPLFNLSVGYYHLGEYEKSIEYFEKVEEKLPRRMLWYQIEPIKAYFKMRNYSRVLEIIENILNDGNKAFSELYQMRGEIYLAQNKPAQARDAFDSALYYNSPRSF